MNQNASGEDKGSCILVLEDEETVRMMVLDALTPRGHTVKEASSLSMARAILQETNVHLVLCDIRLDGDRSGIELLHELACRMPEVVVVMMTGVTDRETAVQCLRDGAIDYLAKPFTSDELLAVVSRSLERRKEMVRERIRVEEKLTVLASFSEENPNPVLRVSKDGRILYANRASEWLLREFQCSLGEKVPISLQKMVSTALGTGERHDVEVQSGQQTFSFAVIPIAGAEYVFLYGHDVTRLKETERELVRLRDQALEMAVHDPLTGLPNRVLLDDRLQQALARNERSRHKLAVAFLDLDYFKRVNDAKGHRAGDHLLVQISRCLRNALRKTDTLARWGGDEMILVVPDLRDSADAKLVFDRLQQAVRELDIPITFSMGVSLYPDDSVMPDLLLQQADLALYFAKVQGRNRVVYYRETQGIQGHNSQIDLRDRLGQAVREERLEVQYQPIIETATGAVAGVEALARWWEPGVGSVSPSTFIPLAEGLGMVGLLGKNVFRMALKQFAEWKRHGLLGNLSLNLSVRQLSDPDLLSHLLQAAEEAGVQTADVILEVTESQALLGVAAEQQQLNDLVHHGFQISIDDFGSGYSSLSSLHTLPVKELKIDMSLVRNLQTEKGRRIVQGILEMARTLGLRTVAEGLENSAEVEIIKEMKPDRLQGYYFSRPLSPQEATVALRATVGAARDRGGRSPRPLGPGGPTVPPGVPPRGHY